MKRLTLMAGVLLVMILVSAGCGKSSTSTTTAAVNPTTTFQASIPVTQTSPQPTSTTVTPKTGGTLRIAWDNSPGGNIGWPPLMLGDGTFPSQMFFDPLLRYTDTGDLVPWLAESYSISAADSSVTFSLRKGVKFHDGTDFNAQAAKWNIDQQIAAKAVANWQSCDVVDDYTIRVHVKVWRNSSIADFADVAFTWMVSPAAYDQHGIDWIKQNPVGTGPFVFAGFEKDVSLKGLKNTSYWKKDDQGKSMPYLDGINWVFITDPMTQLAAMQSGEADLADTETGKRAADMAGAGLKVNAVTTGSMVLFPDTIHADSPFFNQKVREAVEYAIDREAIAKNLGYGYWTTAYQIPAPGCNVYDPNFSLARKYNVDTAKQLLADAGYSNGFKMTLISAPAGRNKDVCTALQGYLGKVGITVDIEYPDQPKYVSYQTGVWQSAMLLQGLPDYPNMNTFLETWLSPSSPRFKSWARSDEFTRLFGISDNAANAEKGLIQAAINQTSKEAALIPVHYSGRCWAMQPFVIGGGFFKRSAPSYFNPEEIWLNK